ncbi:dehydrogenase/reductase SDR family member 7 [Parasteatoda tepidariorum]|uniref:dehydrogenase/reductase SDR family member 7 n=1 Tax=Parasteatoda tepidariorum TaxID=114398 RepID=UPI001C71C754|nr:dehydrogenase/reductase SDR family member 7 [Parasteatoda tepidariorum]
MDLITILIGIFLLFLTLFFFFADADLTLLFYHAFYPPKDFKKEVVWITGASSGIGEYLAYGFIKRNARLALSGVNVERLQNVKKHCLELSKCAEDDILLVPFSIDKFDEHDECVKKVLDHFGKIDILVNNAGISSSAGYADIDIKVDMNLFNVNVFGTVNLTRKVLKHFLEQKKGHVVYTSSMAGKIGTPFTSTYNGSKHAVHGYFESLRTEVHEDNIDVTLACPGPVFSRLAERRVTEEVGKVHHEVRKPTDKKMDTERCSELMLTAIANKVDECWITYQPFLAFLYIAQYMPSFYRNIVVKKVMTKERAKKALQGR